MTTKIFIDSNRLEQDSWELANRIHSTGAQIAVYVQEALMYLQNRRISFGTVHAQSYYDKMVAENGVIVSPMNSFIDNIKLNERVIVIDDIFDQGRTLEAVVNQFKVHGVHNELNIGVLYFKDNDNEVKVRPDFYIKEIELHDWIVFPHELVGLTKSEVESQGFNTHQ